MKEKIERSLWFFGHFLGSERKNLIFYFIASMSGILFLMSSAQPYINDELTYILMVDAVSREGMNRIENGYGRYEDAYLVIHGTNPVVIDGKAEIASFTPPIHPFLVLPFYRLFGLWGLVAANALAHLVTIYAIYRISLRVFDNVWLALFTGVFYGSFTYAVKYAVEIWPHSISVMLAVLATWSALDAKSPRSSFLCGLFIGLATGVRYQNIIFTPIYLIYIYTYGGKKSLVHYLFAVAIPLCLIAYLNFGIYQDPTTTGYGHPLKLLRSWDYRLTNIIFGSIVFLSLTRWRAFIELALRRPRSHILAAGILSISLLFALGLLDYIVEPLRLIYSGLVDFSTHFRSDLLPDKRAMFQATPAISLFFAGAYVGVGKKRISGIVWLLIAISFSEILFISGTYLGDGGVRLMRYFLESLAHMSILASYGVYRVFQRGLPSSPQIVAAFFTLLSLISLEFAFNLFPSPLVWVYGKITAVLALYILYLFFSTSDERQEWILKSAVLLALCMSLAYSFSTVYYLFTLKGLLAVSAQRVDERIMGSSVVFHNTEVDHLAFAHLKTKKDMILARTSDDFVSNDLLASRFEDEGRAIYVISDSNESISSWSNDLIGKRCSELSVEYIGGGSLYRIYPQGHIC